MNSWLLLAAQIIPIGILIYYYIHSKYNYWSRRGVSGPKPSLLTFGNASEIFGPTLNKVELDLFKKYGSVYGCYFGLDPVLTIADPELIKQIMVKDFGMFVNRGETAFFHEHINSNQFFSRDDKWKRLRAITGPTFTSGKLRGMLPIVNECIESLIGNLKGKNGQEIDVKTFSTGFSLDVIMSTAFGTKISQNSQKNEIAEQNALNFMNSNEFKMLLLMTMPAWFNKLVGVKHCFNENSVDYFGKLAKVIIDQRKKGGSLIKKKDLVQLLMDATVSDQKLNAQNYDKLSVSMDLKENESESNIQAQTGSQNALTETEIIAQCILFFAAGFETSSSAITGCIFELAHNLDVQQRLFDEIHKELAGLGLNSDEYHEAVNRIPYLEAVVKETLRKYPPTTRIDRHLNGDRYKIVGIELEKGSEIHVSVWAVHYNSENYPEPEKFNPDRFLPENKHLLIPYTYLPFGAGPRNCIGMRFAYQEIKLLLAQLILNFRFYPSSSTPAKLEFNAMKFTLSFRPFTVKIENRKV